MSSDARTCSIRLIERLFGEGVVAGLSDAELVERFATARNSDAFAAIVARHGPMVMAVCQGLLGSSGDADDAFQATFLVLMNRAGSFSVGASLGGWLYRVARRVARQARVADARRRRRELAARSSGEEAVDCPSERSEIIRLIQQEIDRLPERYRSPIMLCDLQGLTRDEAAGLLGWPAGTVGGRLARARKQLRERLERRGLSPSVALPIFSRTTPHAGPWRSSLEAAIRSASSLAAGNRATPAALGLAALAGRGFLGGSVKMAIVAAVATVAIVGLAAARDTPEPQTAPAAVTPASKPAAVTDPDDPTLAGHFAGRVIGPDGQPIRGASLFIAPTEPAPTKAGPVRAMSTADGRFEFDAPDMTYTEIDGLPGRRQGLLIATADQYQPDWVVTWGQVRMPLHLRADPVKGAELTLKLSRFDVPIHGRLLDKEKQPLAGARVLVSSIKVPSEGKFDADLKTFERAKGHAWPFNYDQSLGAPNVLPGVATEAITDADGRFQISGLGRDRLVELTVTAPNVVDTYLKAMTRDAPDLIFDRDPDGYAARAILGAGFTFCLKPGRTVRGIVRDRETRAPIAGMWVGQGRHALSGLTGTPSPFRSNANGRYEISGIDPAIRDLEVMAVPQPGQPYFMAKAQVGEKSGAMIDCLRGIPFRLKLVDEAGRPADAEVEFRPVMPNPHAVSSLPHEWTFGTFPLNRAVMTAKGVYEGFAIGGPGAVMVKMPGRPDYRPARVDPKALFAPGRTDWTNQELISAYGTEDTLIIGYAWVDQHDYAAIVLVNPPVGSNPLELSATVVRDTPRQVTLLDPEGKPVVGVKPDGLTGFPWDYEPPLRAATIPITKLHPDRSRRITFLKEDRKLIGFLLARGDGDTPYTVRLQPWATVTGRVVDENGDPLPALGQPARENEPAVVLASDSRYELATRDDPQAGWCREVNSDSDGRFRIERLIPGLRYSTVIYRGAGMFAGKAFENLVLEPGETRDLGDIRSKEPVDMRGK